MRVRFSLRPESSTAECLVSATGAMLDRLEFALVSHKAKAWERGLEGREMVKSQADGRPKLIDKTLYSVHTFWEGAET